YWRIVIPGLWPDLDIPRMMFIFVWLIFLLEILVGKRRLLPNTASGIAMMVVIVAFILSMILASRIAIRQLLNGYVIPFAMFAIAKNVFPDKRTVDKFVLWFSLPLSFYFTATAILEHYRVTALIFPRYIGRAMIGEVEVIDYGTRAMGTFLQPAATGYAIVATYVLSLQALSQMKSRLAQLYSLLLTVAAAIGVFFTYTRSVYVAFLAAMLTLLLMSRRRRVIALVLLIGMGLAVMGNWSNVTGTKRETGGVGEVSTAKTRLVLAQASMLMFFDHPFFGVGFTCFMQKAGPYIGQIRTTLLGYREAWQGTVTNQHNQLLSILIEIGLIGFIPFVLLYYFMIRDLARARKRLGANYDHETLVSVWAILLAYMAVNMFIEPRFYEFMNVLPYMFVGMVTGGLQRGEIARRNKADTGNNVLGKEC
ncbi:MAG: O-antigen ligase family protein, partial [bacterium]